MKKLFIVLTILLFVITGCELIPEGLKQKETKKVVDTATLPVDPTGIPTFSEIKMGTATLTHDNVTHSPIYSSGQTGLDDLSSSGTYTLTDHAIFQIRIQAVGTPDNFEWRKGSIGSWSAPVAMTGSAQLLQDGISVTWAATTGHTIKNTWEMHAGTEIHIDGALHIDDVLLVSGDLIAVGATRSLSAIKLLDGIRFINSETGNSEFHQYISGTDSAITPLPSAFDGTLVFKTNVGSNPSDMDAVFWDGINLRPSFVLNQGGVGRTSVFERSLVIGAQKGVKTLDTNYSIGTSDYPRLDFNTSATGADLGVEDDAQVKGNLYVDTINESTTDAGVTIDGVLIKDGTVVGLAGADPGVTGIVSGGSYAASGSFPKQIDLLTATTIRTVDFSTPGSPVTSTLVISPTAPVTFSTGDIPANTTHWVAVKNNGGSPQWSTFADVTTINRREYAILGTAWTDGSNNITGINKTPFYTASVGYDLADYILATSNFSFKINNGIISPAGVGNLLKINRAEGKYWRYFGWSATTPKNRHTGTDAAITPITTYYTYNATGGYTTPSDVDVDNYDLSGVTTAIPNNKWAVHRIYHYAGTPYDGLQRGIAVYSSLEEAKSNVGEEDFVRNPDNEYAALVGYIYVEKGCIDLSDVDCASVVSVSQGVAGGGGGGIGSIVEDATPQLGGDLDANGQKFTNSQGTHILIEEKVSIMTPSSPNDDYLRITGATDSAVVLGLDQKGVDNYVGVSYKRDNSEHFFAGLTDVLDKFVIRNATGNFLVVEPAGDVGIGLDNPNAKLDISSTANELLNLSTTATFGNMALSSPTTNVVLQARNDYGRMGTASADPFFLMANATDYLGLHVSGGLSLGGTYQVTDPGINNFIVEGSVGIGVTSPTNKLDIVSGSRSGTHATGNALYVISTSNELDGIAEFRHNNGTRGVSIGYEGISASGSLTDAALTLASKGNESLILRTNSVDRLTIAGDGKITTPSYINNVRTVGGQFNGSSATDFYSDTYITFRWDNTTSQPTFIPKTGAAGWWDISNHKIDGGNSNASPTWNAVGDVSTVALTTYYFSQDGVRDTNFDMETYSSKMVITIGREGSISYPTYLLTFWVTTTSACSWKLDVISP